MSNISLDGIEITIIKAIGFGGAPVLGKDLKAKLPNIQAKEIVEVLKSLVDVGFVINSDDFSDHKDLDDVTFFVNPGYAKDIKDAIDPEPEERGKRVRRQ
jgi:hypothetical protein